MDGITQRNDPSSLQNYSLKVFDFSLARIENQPPTLLVVVSALNRGESFH